MHGGTKNSVLCSKSGEISAVWVWWEGIEKKRSCVLQRKKNTKARKDSGEIIKLAKQVGFGGHENKDKYWLNIFMKTKAHVEILCIVSVNW